MYNVYNVAYINISIDTATAHGGKKFIFCCIKNQPQVRSLVFSVKLKINTVHKRNNAGNNASNSTVETVAPV